VSERPKVREVLLKVTLMDVDYAYVQDYIDREGLADPKVYAAHELKDIGHGCDNVVEAEVLETGPPRDITDAEAAIMAIPIERVRRITLDD
jgi:hypothetical protein